MKIKDYICKCGKDDFFFADKGNQKGIYCSYCGKWLKWADKDEQNLAMEQEPVLDKIQREIKRVDTVCHASNNHDELIRRNVVLQIIDKYKVGSEG